MVIAEIEGIGPAFSVKLEAAGVRSPDALLKAGATRHGRRALAEQTGIREELILEWVNHADLMRLKGVGPEYADLLEEAGVDSPRELGHRRPDHLAKALHDLDAAKHVVRRVPSEKMVAKWVAQARGLATVVEH